VSYRSALRARARDYSVQFWPSGNIMLSTSASDVTSGWPKSLFSKG
jgi:hypothetical protein